VRRTKPDVEEEIPTGILVRMGEARGGPERSAAVGSLAIIDCWRGKSPDQRWGQGCIGVAWRVTFT
jgi:hypothetical protein